MSLQQTALQQSAEAGADDWELADQPGTGAPNALEVSQQDDPNAEAIEQQDEQTAQPLTLEDIARELGWTPKEQWRGDPNKWTPASEYLRTTGRVLDRTKSELKQYRGAVQTLEQRLARVEKGHQSIEAQRADQLNNEYEEAKYLAAKDGNDELYRKLVKEQREVMAKFKPADRPQEARPQEADVYAQAEAIMSDPLATRFFQANPIALQDEAAWDLINREMTVVAERGGTPAQQFRAAEEALRYAFAEAYEAPKPHHAQEQARDERGKFASGAPQQQQQRRPAPPVAAASRAAPNTGKSAVDRLGPEAKAFLDAEIASGEVKDPDRWARVYLGEKPPIIGAA